jgi:hypothetical protein
MNEVFKGGKTTNLATEYSEKIKYRKFLLETGYEFLDTLYQKSLYGFINRNYEVIAPTPDTSILETMHQDQRVLRSYQISSINLGITTC